MRLGEIKNIIDRVIGDNNQITIDHSPVYEGQVQAVSNFGDIMKALSILSKQSWNTQDYAPIQIIGKKYKISHSAKLEATDFNQLNSYISVVNSQLPLYYSILETMVEDQDEKAINIKLPNDIKSLEDLEKFNKRLENVLKQFNVDGEFIFDGFDVGSKWYKIIPIAGFLSYHCLLGSLKISQEYFKTRTEYFESQEAKISYQIAVEKSKDESKDSFKNFQKKWLEKFIEEKVKDAMKEMKETNGRTEPELENKIIMATTALIKELDEGTEFHLSLNPPDYAEEVNGSLKIDYERIRAIKEADKKPKKIEAPKKDEAEEAKKADSEKLK